MSNSDNSAFARILSPYAAWGELAAKLEDDDFKAEYVQSPYALSPHPMSM